MLIVVLVFTGAAVINILSLGGLIYLDQKTKAHNINQAHSKALSLAKNQIIQHHSLNPGYYAWEGIKLKSTTNWYGNLTKARALLYEVRTGTINRQRCIDYPNRGYRKCFTIDKERLHVPKVQFSPNLATSPKGNCYETIVLKLKFGNTKDFKTLQEYEKLTGLKYGYKDYRIRDKINIHKTKRNERVLIWYQPIAISLTGRMEYYPTHSTVAGYTRNVNFELPLELAGNSVGYFGAHVMKLN